VYFIDKEGREREREGGEEGRELLHQLIKNEFAILLSTVHIMSTSSTYFEVIYLYKSITIKEKKQKFHSCLSNVPPRQVYESLQFNG